MPKLFYGDKEYDTDKSCLISSRSRADMDSLTSIYEALYEDKDGRYFLYRAIEQLPNADKYAINAPSCLIEMIIPFHGYNGYHWEIPEYWQDYIDNLYRESR